MSQFVTSTIFSVTGAGAQNTASCSLIWDGNSPHPKVSRQSECRYQSAQVCRVVTDIRDEHPLPLQHGGPLYLSLSSSAAQINVFFHAGGSFLMRHTLASRPHKFHFLCLCRGSPWTSRARCGVYCHFMPTLHPPGFPWLASGSPPGFPPAPLWLLPGSTVAKPISSASLSSFIHHFCITCCHTPCLMRAPRAPPRSEGRTRFCCD